MIKTKNNNKKTIIILVIAVILIIAVVAIYLINRAGNSDGNGKNQTENQVESYVQEIEDGIKVNTSTAMNTSKTLGDLLITNIQLSNRSGMTSFLADVTNNGTEATQVKTIQITLLSYDGEELAKLTGVINSLEPGETTELNIATTSNYITAYDFRIEEK